MYLPGKYIPRYEYIQLKNKETARGLEKQIYPKKEKKTCGDKKNRI